MPKREQIEAKVGSSMLLNVGAGLVSSLVIYVSFTETRQVATEWPFVMALVFFTGLIFEWGRLLAYRAED